uniref:Epidermal growth factor-like protein 7 n=1 Tax=Cacopsylla melanoneura TaxID=428564 RepID=A0A8D8QS23_9HEMI
MKCVWLKLSWLVILVVQSCWGDSYSKHTTGRRVCSPKAATQDPVKVTVPTFQKFTKKCYENQICKGVRLTYETKYECCPGWVQNSKLSHGCNQPVCSRHCENGGKCVAPETCTCSPGFTGPFCEADLNECDLYQPCSHECTNTHGTYHCKCSFGYTLTDDKRTCVKDWTTKFATEARDLEIEFINPNRKNFKKKHRTRNDSVGGDSEGANVPVDNQSSHVIKRLENKIEEMRKSHKEEFASLESKISQLFSKIEILQQRLQNCAACDYADRENRHPNFLDKLRKINSKDVDFY